MVSINPNPTPQGFYFFDPSTMALPGVNNLPPPPPPPSTTATAASTVSEDPNKKIRKPYTITKSRESWTDQEHDKFLEALQLFDRDWKKIEAFVGSKTVIQIRSHAQKYFLKVQKSGTSEHVPPPRPKRKAAHPYPQKAPKNTPTASPQVMGPLQPSPAFVDPTYIYSTDSSSVLGTPVTNLPLSSLNFNAPPPASLPQVTTDDTGWTGSGQAVPVNCCYSSSNEKQNSKGVNEGSAGKPVKVMPDFAQVYRFIGSVFDPNSTNQLQRLKQMDPINVETALLLMRNLSINLTSPEFEDHVRFRILMYLFETYLEVRQLRENKLTTLPKTLEGVISEDTFQKTRSYSLDHSHFHFVRDFVMIVRDSAILFFGVMPWFWKKSEDFVTSIGLNADNEMLHSIAFLAGCMILLQITKLPLSSYLVFVLEARHDCNKFTPVYAAGLLFGNMIKGIIVALLVGPPIVAAIIFLVPKGGPYLAIYVWALGHVFITYVHVIAPLFKKITPLPEGQLKEKIEELAASLKFPAKKLLVVDDGSKRSNKHSNVQMTGLFYSTGIFLDDKIVQQDKNDEEVLAVIAHELGHWKLNHYVPIYVAMQFVPLLNGGGFTLARNSTDLFQSFGFDSQPVIIGLIIYLLFAAPLNRLVTFGRNNLFRSIEFQADAFAVKLGYSSALRSVLVKKQMENLTEFNADPWYYAYRVTLPPVVLRLTAIDEVDKKAD